MNLRRWLQSFRYAYEGLIYALSSQRNMKFHFFVAFCVVLLALILDMSRVELLFILLAVTFILVTELINTAIEKTVDLAMPEQHPIAKIAKDVAAASVLVASFFAVAVGVIIFFEPLEQLLTNLYSFSKHQSEKVSSLWMLTALLLLIIIVLHARFSKAFRRFRPSILAAIAFLLATFLMLLTEDTLVALLAYSLAVMVMLLLHDKTERSLTALLVGAVLGSVVMYLTYYFI